MIVLRNTLLLLILILLIRCEEDKITSRDYPRVKTLSVTEITSEGATFNAQIIYRGNFEVINYGFVWGEGIDPRKEVSDRVLFAENIQNQNFSEVIEISLKKDVTYSVRAFVETHEFIVYGENVDFISLGSNGPELIDFTPKNGHHEDTIYISGKNFGRVKSNVEVRLDDYSVQIIDFAEKEISVLIPSILSTEKSTLSISVAGNITTFNEEFTLFKPVIKNFNPANATFGSLIEIDGENFDTRPNKITVAFKGTDESIYPSELISVTENRLEIEVPQAISSKQNEVFVSMNNFIVVGNQKITILDPVITSISPESGKTLSEITISGEHFSSVISNNSVEIDGFSAEIISAKNNELLVSIPDQSNHIYSSRNVQLTVKVLDTESQADDTFAITDKWFRIDNLPFTSSVWKGLTINEQGYVFFDGGLWKYNAESNQWTELTPFPGIKRSSPRDFFRF